MSDAKFDIIFRGDVVVGHNIVEVKQRLAQLFKVDMAKVNDLFTGKAVPLKRNLDQTAAEKYQKVLIQAGAQVSLAQTGGVPIEPRKVVRPAPAVAPQSTSVTSAPTLTLKERLAQSEAEASAKARQAEVVAKQKASAKVQGSAVGGLTLAPVGAILGASKPGPAPSVLPEVSNISLRPMTGELLDKTERKVILPVEVDVSTIALAEVGVNMLDDADRVEIPLPELDFADFDVAEVGSDLLDDVDKQSVPPRDVDTTQFNLAPVGSDLGQIKRSTPPSPPDTSSISLAD